VHDVLFPYARTQLRSWLAGHERDAREAVARLQQEAGRSLDRESLASYVESLMDRDVKSPGLKQLQGLIWRDGYETGGLSGEVFDDVPRAFERWARAGLAIAIYSSGSVLAQQLLFSSVPGGTLVPSIDRFFDTGVGAKTSASSYGRIAAEMALAPARLLFVSDSREELNAARAAGCQVAWSVRPGNAVAEALPDVPEIHSFDDLR